VNITRETEVKLTCKQADWRRQRCNRPSPGKVARTGCKRVQTKEKSHADKGKVSCRQRKSLMQTKEKSLADKHSAQKASHLGTHALRGLAIGF
jgi:hypothetical protein